MQIDPAGKYSSGTKEAQTLIDPAFTDLKGPAVLIDRELILRNIVKILAKQRKMIF